MDIVMDSWALMAHLEGEQAGAKVRELLKGSGERKVLLNVVNWGEVLYNTERRYGVERKEAVVSWINQMGILVVDLDQEQTRLAAHYKAHRKMSYADCFAAALTKLRKAELVTGDKEFKEVEKEIKILWLS